MYKLGFIHFFSWCAVLSIVSACGVKGAPTPYIEAYPERKKEAFEPMPSSIPSPSPSLIPETTPATDSKTKKPKVKKKR